MPHIVYIGSGYSGHWEVREREALTQSLHHCLGTIHENNKRSKIAIGVG